MESRPHYPLAPVETLGARIARLGALPPPQAVGWVFRLAKSLEAIHSLGVPHGRVSAECFRIETDAPTSRGVLVDVRQVPVQLSHHSPDRIAGGNASLADDAWALGVTLYFALTARLPLDRAADSSARPSGAPRAPAPLSAFGVRDNDLQRCLDRALAQDRRARPRTIAELRSDLEAWLACRGIEDLSPMRPDGTDRGGSGSDIRVTPVWKAPPANTTAPIPREAVSPEVDSSDPTITGPTQVWMGSNPKDAVRNRAATNPPAAAPKPRRGSLGYMLVATLLAGAAIAGGFVWVRVLKRPLPFRTAAITRGFRSTARLTAPAPSAAAGDSTPPMAPSGTASAAPLVNSLANGAIAGSVAAPPDSAELLPSAPDAGSKALFSADARTACFRPLFAQGTFEKGREPDLSFLCNETDPRKGGDALRAAVVRANIGRPASEGMHEWALFNWYEPAAFTIVRAACCPSPAPVVLPRGDTACDALDGALNDLAAMATSGDSVAADEALGRYTRAVNCVTRLSHGGRNGHYTRLRGGEDTAFKKTLARVLAAPKPPR